VEMMMDMQKPKRPRRQKKADRIFNPQAHKDQIMCDYAIAPMDRLAIQMDTKWGIDMLPELVSVETAQKYGSAMAKMNKAIEENNPEECKVRAEIVVRGLKAMDAEAERLGAQRASTDIWEIELDGEMFGIMKDGRSWQKIKEQRPDLELLTLREVALAYRHFRDHKAGEFEKAVKESFPAAEVIDIRAKPKVFDDDIPF
jgi:hypothetical protein